MSRRFFTKQALNVFSLEIEEWEYGTHGHNFYEIIFIESGNGLQIMNEVEVPYSTGDIFLLTPNDEHSFEIEEKSVLTYVKFTEQIFAEKNEYRKLTEWQKTIDRILFNPNTRPGTVISSYEEKQKLFTLLSMLKVEYAQRDIFSRHLTLDLFDAIIIVIARSLNERSKTLTYKEASEIDKVSAVLSYIRQHIFEKEMLSIKAIAETFFLAPNYVGIYVKKHTGMSLRQIIIQTKLKTAERMLTSSQLTISEIASRLQFSDASHFSKIFKKYKGKTPKSSRMKKVIDK